jgi:Interferon-inducible GTPase (IIGP)
MGNLISNAFQPLLRLFTDSPDKYNLTNAQIEEHLERERKAIEDKEKAEADAADARSRLDESLKREAEAKEREEEARQRERESREREADIQKRQEAAKHAAEEAQVHLEQARLQGEELKKREKEAKEKEEEAKRLADESKRATLDAQRREHEANDRVLETQNREADARKAADEAQKREEQVQKDLQQAKFYLEKGIQPEVWPTEEEFQLAKKRVQYDPEKLHFGVCGSSGSGKSSLINAFRGLMNKNPQAAPTGVVETTKAITRYPEPREELPYNRLVWYDCPGAGTLEIPGWLYFNQQGLFIFDIIVLVYDSVIISTGIKFIYCRLILSS